ncbi:DcaP family trimeric outer membrane transporter [Sinimarinibacterium thermocellulolyticum]|uniref:DcaP family trimeric outer membrane transporter n=1 Tax=Sinimarinibacterium thermocellulolyticum TaxID=3170016 RepID=A0ABV2AD68_9GAMM
MNTPMNTRRDAQPWLRHALAASIACASGVAQAGETRFGETTLNWGGYVKLDVLYSRFSEGEVAQSTSRDLYVPSTIPVSAGGGSSYDALDLHAKETRLFLGAKTPLENGVTLGAHIEFDFIVNQGAGNEVVTNAYNPGLRRAFITYGNWLLGQEWSTFQNLGAIPETLDFVAFPTDGTVFDRQPMVRYGSGPFAIAIENPETTVTGLGAKNDSRVPDLVARWITPVGNGGNFGIAGIVRQLAADDADNPATEADEGLDADAIGYGLSVSGKLPLGPNDDIRFMANWGEGIGRYIGLGISADAVRDGDDLEAIGIAAGYIAYRHAWSPKLRTTITASTFQADNDVVLTGDGVTKRIVSGSVNLLYSPVAKITVGAEYRHAEREVESGADGSLDRLQFSAKYVF